MSKKDNLSLSIWFMVLYSLTVSLSGALMKPLMLVGGVAFILWLRFLGSALVMWWIVVVTTQPRKFPHAWKPLLIRVFFAISAQILFFISIYYGSIMIAVLLLNTSPLFVPIVRRITHKSKVAGYVWLSLMISFIGMCIVLFHPDSHADWTALLALLAGILNACSQVVLHSASSKEDPFIMNLWIYTITVAVFSLVLIQLPVVEMLVAIYHEPLNLTMMTAVIVLSVSMQVFVTKSYRHISDPSLVMPFMYSSVIFSAVIDWQAFGVVPTLQTWIGVLLIVGASIYSIVKRRKP